MTDRIDQLNEEYQETLEELRDAARKPIINNFIMKLKMTMETEAILRSYQQLNRENAQDVASKMQATKEMMAWLQSLAPSPDQTEEETI